MTTTEEMFQVVNWLRQQHLGKRPSKGEWNDPEYRGDLVKAFHQVLKDMDHKFVFAVMETWVNSQKWFPAPCDIRTSGIDLMFSLLDIPNASVAWNDIIRVRNIQWAYPRHYRTTPTFSSPVVNAVVGYIKWQTVLNTPEEEEKWLRQRFFKLYDEELENLKSLALMPESARAMALEKKPERREYISKLFAGYLITGDS